MKILEFWKRMWLIITTVSILMLFFLHPIPVHASNGQTTIIMFDNVKQSYDVGDKITATIRVSSPDGSYLTKAYCGFGYNASTMKKLTETESPDHIWLKSDTPVKWLSGTIEFEMKTDGKMYFIAGAYHGDGVIEAYKADGSRIECPRASVVYKIGTGIYTATSDCNLKSCVIKDKQTGNRISFNRDFDVNITEYWAEVPSSCNLLEIEAFAELEEDTVILPEDLTLKPGENEISVGVQAVDENIKYYVFHITRPTEEVEILDIQITDHNGDLVPFEFNQDIYSYDINVGESCEELHFEVKAGEHTTAEYTETVLLKPGYSSEYITARTFSDEKTYEFYIHRQLSSLSLSSLVIETSDQASYSLSPEFDPGITEYKMEVPSDVNKATAIYTIANINDYLKNENVEFELTHGDNKLNLVVTDGINEKTYTVHVTRKERVVFTEEKKEDDEFVIRRNTSEHTGFNYVDLFFVAAIGMLLIAAVVGVVAIMLFRSKKDYDTSNEAISAKQEKERKQRLKAIKDAEQKAEKEKKKNKKGK